MCCDLTSELHSYSLAFQYKGWMAFVSIFATWSIIGCLLMEGWINGQRIMIMFIYIYCCGQGIWPHKLPFGLGAGEGGFPSVVSQTVHRSWLWLMETHWPTGNIRLLSLVTACSKTKEGESKCCTTNLISWEEIRKVMRTI